MFVRNRLDKILKVIWCINLINNEIDILYYKLQESLSQSNHHNTSFETFYECSY